MCKFLERLQIITQMFQFLECVEIRDVNARRQHSDASNSQTVSDSDIITLTLQHAVKTTLLKYNHHLVLKLPTFQSM